MRRILRSALTVLFATLALPAQGVDAGGSCGAQRLKAAAKFCDTELACLSRYVKAPRNDRNIVRYEACTTRAQARLDRSLAAIASTADRKGARCTVREDAVRIRADALVEGTKLGVLTGWDEEFPDPVDSTFRASLLRAGGKACRKTFSAVARDALEHDEDRLEKSLSKPLLGFVKAASKATASAARKDAGAQCGAASVNAAAAYCDRALACEAVHAGSPHKDPYGSRRAACLGKADARLDRGLAKANERADRKGAACTIGEDAVRLYARGLAGDARRTLLSDRDETGGNGVDESLRSSLLGAAGKACRKSFQSVARDAIEHDEDKLGRRLLSALDGFKKAADRANARAQRKGGRAVGPNLIQSVVDGIRATAEQLAAQTDAARMDEQLLQAVVDNVGATAESLVPENVGDTHVFQVVSGNSHSCLLRTDDSVQCWGFNDAGQASAPGGRFVAIAAGLRHTCGIRESDGRAECWGDDALGQVRGAPREELGFFLSAGGNHTCAIRAQDSTVVCWGQTNNPALTTPPFPDKPYFDVSVGHGGHTCAWGQDGSVDCWGLDFVGQASPAESGFRQVSAGGLHTCGIRTDSSAVCWGLSPQPPGGIFSDIASGVSHTCAIQAFDARASCWGDAGSWSAPPDSETFLQISAGYQHTCAIRDEARPSVMCWGEDTHGQVSCDGVRGCTGTAPPPCTIANEGPLVDKVGRITVTQVLDDPVNDYRLIVPKSHVDLLRDLAPDSEPLAKLVGAFDARGFSCDGDDRIAIEFPGEEVEVLALLEELGVLEPMIGFVLDEVIQPIKDWYRDQLLAQIQEFLASCLFELVIFQSSCVSGPAVPFPF